MIGCDPHFGTPHIQEGQNGPKAYIQNNSFNICLTLFANVKKLRIVITRAVRRSVEAA